MSIVNRDAELKVLGAATELLQNMASGVAPPEMTSEEAKASLARAITSPDSVSSDKPDNELYSLIPLLKEYTLKLQQILSGNSYVNSLPDNARQKAVQRITPASRRLAQMVSQRLNRVKSDFLRIELELRLAEYEAALASLGSI